MRLFFTPACDALLDVDVDTSDKPDIYTDVLLSSAPVDPTIDQSCAEDNLRTKSSLDACLNR